MITSRRGCDFTSHASVNEYYPPHPDTVRYGQMNCPYSLISVANTQEARGRIVRDWRRSTPNQQIQKMNELFSAAQQERQQQNTRKRASVAADGTDVTDGVHQPLTRTRSGGHRTTSTAQENSASTTNPTVRLLLVLSHLHTSLSYVIYQTHMFSAPHSLHRPFIMDFSIAARLLLRHQLLRRS